MSINPHSDITPLQIKKLIDEPWYSYKGKDYKIIKIVKIKSVVTNQWFDGVEYQPLYDMPPGEWDGSFVRPIANFLELFSPTPEKPGEERCNCKGVWYHDQECKYWGMTY